MLRQLAARLSAAGRAGTRLAASASSTESSSSPASAVLAQLRAPTLATVRRLSGDPEAVPVMLQTTVIGEGAVEVRLRADRAGAVPVLGRMTVEGSVLDRSTVSPALRRLCEADSAEVEWYGGHTTTSGSAHHPITTTSSNDSSSSSSSSDISAAGTPREAISLSLLTSTGSGLCVANLQLDGRVYAVCVPMLVQRDAPTAVDLTVRTQPTDGAGSGGS